MSKYRVGEKLICIVHPEYGERPDRDIAGHGWAKNLVFTVGWISGSEERPIYWPGIEQCGVFEEFVELYGNGFKKNDKIEVEGQQYTIYDFTLEEILTVCGKAFKFSEAKLIGRKKLL